MTFQIISGLEDLSHFCECLVMFFQPPVPRFPNPPWIQGAASWLWHRPLHAEQPLQVDHCDQWRRTRRSERTRQIRCLIMVDHGWSWIFPTQIASLSVWRIIHCRTTPYVTKGWWVETKDRSAFGDQSLTVFSTYRLSSCTRSLQKYWNPFGRMCWWLKHSSSHYSVDMNGIADWQGHGQIVLKLVKSVGNSPV